MPIKRLGGWLGSDEVLVERSTGGVTPRTAQATVRHSSIDLTRNVYTHPRELNVHRALDVVPSLPLSGSPQPDRQRAKATGTVDHQSVATTVAPNLGKCFIPGSFADTADDQAVSTKKNPIKLMLIGVFGSALGRTRTCNPWFRRSERMDHLLARD